MADAQNYCPSPEGRDHTTETRCGSDDHHLLSKETTTKLTDEQGALAP
jgi:hypothetical protein